MKKGDDEYIAVGVGAGLLETNDILIRIADALEERNRLLSEWREWLAWSEQRGERADAINDQDTPVTLQRKL